MAGGYLVTKTVAELREGDVLPGHYTVLRQLNPEEVGAPVAVEVRFVDGGTGIRGWDDPATEIHVVVIKR